MTSNAVNLNFFMAKNGVSWENIGLTKPNTECIAGQASPPVSPRPSSRSSTRRPSPPVRVRDTRSPTSGARQEAARSPIRKWSRDSKGSLERRKYPKAPRFPFASTFHIKNSPRMSEKRRQERTADITRFRSYIKQRTLNLAENVAVRAREAAEKAWLAAMEAKKAAVEAEEVARTAEEAFENLKWGEPQQVDQNDDISDLSDGNKTPTTPLWTLSEEGSIEYRDAASGAGEGQAPFESISMEDFPGHEEMLECDANEIAYDQIASGFADLTPRKLAKPSEAEMEQSLEEARDKLEKCRELLSPLQRKFETTQRAMGHVRSMEAKGREMNARKYINEARIAERAVHAGRKELWKAIKEVRLGRWPLEKPGELRKKRSRLSQMHGAGFEKDA